jgi:hypothetical protein
VASAVTPIGVTGSTGLLGGRIARRLEKAGVAQRLLGRGVHLPPGLRAPDWQVDAWVSTYTAIAAGELDGVTDDVERISGHPATSLTNLLRG